MISRERTSRRKASDNPGRQGNTVCGAAQCFERGVRAFADEDDLQRALQQLDIVEEGCERKEVPLDLARKGLDNRLGATSIRLFPVQRRQPAENPDQSAIAGRNGGIGGCLWAGWPT